MEQILQFAQHFDYSLRFLFESRPSECGEVLVVLDWSSEVLAVPAWAPERVECAALLEATGAGTCAEGVVASRLGVPESGSGKVRASDLPDVPLLPLPARRFNDFAWSDNLFIALV